MKVTVVHWGSGPRVRWMVSAKLPALAAVRMRVVWWPVTRVSEEGSMERVKSAERMVSVKGEEVDGLWTVSPL